MSGKGKFIELTHEDLVYHVCNYYKQIEDFLTYYSIKKELCKNQFKTLIKVLRNGGGKYLLDVLDYHFNRADVVDLDLIEVDEEKGIFDCDGDEFTHNQELNVYVNIESKILTQSMETIVWFSYIRLV